MGTEKLEDKEVGTPSDKLIARAIKNFDLCVTNTSEFRSDALDDLRFLNGKQWTDDMMRERSADRRPALTVNRLLTFKNQVVNDGLQNRPSIKYRPVDDLTDPDTADVINGIARHILNNGDSKTAIDTAYDYAVSCSVGFFRVCTDYKDDDSFNQEIYIDRIENPLSVYIPIHLCKQADWSDAPFLFIRQKYSKDSFKEKWPKIDITQWPKSGLGDAEWVTEDCVYVAEYFECETEYVEIYLLADGKKVNELPKGQKAVKTRKVEVKKWYRYLISQNEILEEKKEWPCKYHPIIPILGQEFCIDGKKSYISLTRFAKDPQKMHNFWITAFTEQIALQPKAPFLVAEGQIKDKQAWKNMNNKTTPYLEYSPISLNGTSVPPPHRIEPPQIGQAIIEGISLTSESLKEVTGIYDASLGARSNENSGKAIIARQRQGDTANFHFVNNYNRAIRHLGRILIDLIPEIYDTARTVRIIGEDETDKVVMINQMHQDPNTKENKLYDLTVGKYDVIADVGPSYETKRLESADMMQSVLQAYPQLMMVCGDLFFRNMDTPGADEMAKRLKKTIPPQYLEDETGGKGAVSENEIRQIVGDLQNLQQQLAGSQQEKAQLFEIIKKMDAIIKDKSEERQVKMDTAVIRADAELQKAKMQITHDATSHAIDTGFRIHEINNQMAASPAPAQNAEEINQGVQNE